MKSIQVDVSAIVNNIVAANYLLPQHESVPTSLPQFQQAWLGGFHEKEFSPEVSKVIVFPPLFFPPAMRACLAPSAWISERGWLESASADWQLLSNPSEK